MMELKNGGLPRWVEPIAWDAAGALYYLWADPAGVRLARSNDRGSTWQQWLVVATDDASAFFPFLTARGQGDLAATWFTAKLSDYSTLRAHVVRMTVSTSGAPQVTSAPPFTFEAVNAQGIPQPGGEYVPVAFLRNGSLAVVTPIQNPKAERLGFSWWIVD
jgi:hypothetical protein